MKKLLLSIIATSTLSIAVEAQFFTETTGLGHTFLDINKSASIFGDVDNDGDQDLLIMGESNASSTYPYYSNLYLNDGNGLFTEDTSIQGVVYGSIDLGDIDGDGDLDFIVTGGDAPMPINRVADIYTNNGSGKFAKSISLPQGIESGSSAKFGDINGDSILDIIALGYAALNDNNIYIGDSVGSFATITSALPFGASSEGDFEFVDVDGDSDLDMIVVGKNAGTTNPMVQLLLNDSLGNYTISPSSSVFEVASGFAKIAVADIDGDNDMDIIISGHNGLATNYRKVNVYTNDGNGAFTKVSGHGLLGIFRGDLNFVDFDNDNDMDLLISGNSNSAFHSTKLYSNDGNGVFSEVITNDFDNIFAYLGSVSFADVDGNGKVDLFITGVDSSGAKSSKLFMNTYTPTTSIKKKVKNSLSIHPNPATTILNVSITDAKINEIAIMDLTGKVVINKTTNASIISIAELKSGIYFLQVQTDKGVLSSKFIKK